MKEFWGLLTLVSVIALYAEWKFITNSRKHLLVRGRLESNLEDLDAVDPHPPVESNDMTKMELSTKEKIPAIPPKPMDADKDVQRRPQSLDGSNMEEEGTRLQENINTQEEAKTSVDVHDIDIEGEVLDPQQKEENNQTKDGEKSTSHNNTVIKEGDHKEEQGADHIPRKEEEGLEKQGSSEDKNKAVVCQEMRFKPKGVKWPFTALASYQGSGNTWYRHLLEMSTGM